MTLPINDVPAQIPNINLSNPGRCLSTAEKINPRHLRTKRENSNIVVEESWLLYTDRTKKEDGANVKQRNIYDLARQISRMILAHPIYTVAMVIITLVSVIGDDFLILVLPKRFDTGMGPVSIICLTAFLLDLLLNFLGFGLVYVKTIFFPLDLLSLISAVPPVLGVFGISSFFSTLSMARLGRVARMAARVGRLAKAIRLVRVVLREQSEDEENVVFKAGQRLHDLTVRNLVAAVLLTVFIPQILLMLTDMSNNDDVQSFAVKVLDMSNSSRECQMSSLQALQNYYGKRLLYAESYYINTNKRDISEMREDIEIIKVEEGGTIIWIDFTSQVKMAAIVNIIQAVYVILLLLVGNFFFVRNAERLFIRPVNNMMLTLRKLEESPVAELTQTNDIEQDAKPLVDSWKRLAQSLAQQTATAIRNSEVLQKAIQLTTQIVNSIARMDLDEADNILQSEVPSELSKLLVEVVNKLRNYRPFLPNTLFLHSDSESTDDEGDTPRKSSRHKLLPTSSPTRLQIPQPQQIVQDSPTPEPLPKQHSQLNTSHILFDPSQDSTTKSNSPIPPSPSEPIKPTTNPLVSPTVTFKKSNSNDGLKSSASSTANTKSGRRPSSSVHVHGVKTHTRTRTNTDTGLKQRLVTVLLCEILNFGSIISRQGSSAIDVEQIITDFLTICYDAAKQNRGSVTTLGPGSILASWNAVQTVSSHQQYACTCALNIHKGMRQMEMKWSARGWPSLKAVIAVHSESQFVGNAGPESQKAFQFAGTATVSCGMVLELGRHLDIPVLATRSVYELVEHHFFIREVDVIKLPVGRSKTEPIQIYELLSEAESAQDEWMYCLQNKEHKKFLTDYHLAYRLFVTGKLSESLKAFSNYMESLSPNTLPKCLYYLIDDDHIVKRFVEVCHNHIQRELSIRVPYCRAPQPAWVLLPGERSYLWCQEDYDEEEEEYLSSPPMPLWELEKEMRTSTSPFGVSVTSPRNPPSL